MPVLSNHTADALQDVKGAIADKITLADNAGNVWKRIRYADNLTDYLKLSTIEGQPGVEVLRLVFVYLSGFTSQRAEARNRLITATFSIEVLQGFYDGTDEDNSTLTYERLLGDLEELFKIEDGLGFTDIAGQEVLNGGFQANPGENEGKPVYVDGILSHRSIGSLEVKFRLC